MDIRRSFFTWRVFGPWNSSLGKWGAPVTAPQLQHQLDRPQKVFGLCFQADGVILGVFCTETGVALNCLDGSLPAQYIL